MGQEPSETRGTVVIGITGGIGSGKSAVAEYIRQVGYTVFTSDETAKHLMNDDPELRIAIKQMFGAGVFDPNGFINRKALAEKVFGDNPKQKELLQELNKLVHPRVLDEHQRQIEKCAEEGAKLVFIESALIYEAELEDAFDYIIVVDAPEEVRIQRVMQRSKLTEEQVRSRMSQQMSPNQKKNWADFVIDNSSTPEKLHSAVAFLLPILATMPPQEPSDDTSDEDTEEMEQE